MAKPAKWKPISRDMAARFVAIAPGGEFVVFGDFVATIDGAATKVLVVQHRSGESIQVAVPGTLGGLKRRTRAMFGRCQGFYCGARVQALLNAQVR